MGKWRKAFGLEEKEEVVVLADEKEDIEVLIEPDGNQKMTGHAEQHSALTRIQKDNVVKFAATKDDIIELGTEVDRNTGDIDDISEYLGGIYFEISLGKDKYVFDTPAVPQSGNFTAFSYVFDEDNTKFSINAYLKDGNPSTLFEKARPGDKLNIVYPNSPASNFGQYFITSTRLDGEVWIIEGDFIQGSGRLTAGFSYDIEIVHITKQFNDDGVGGENHSEEISDLTKRVDNNTDNILELRNNDEYLNNKIDNNLLPKFYPSGKRNYKTAPSVSSDSGSSHWFVAAASHTNGTGNAWPGNANAIHLYYDADQHDMIATGAGTILIFDKEDDKIMIHAVVTGTPLKQKMSGKDCWSFEIVLIEALGRQWDYTSEYEMTLSGVFWAA